MKYYSNIFSPLFQKVTAGVSDYGSAFQRGYRASERQITHCLSALGFLVVFCCLGVFHLFCSLELSFSTSIAFIAMKVGQMMSRFYCIGV